MNARELDAGDSAYAQRSPANLAEVASDGKWRRARHLELIDDKLLALAERRIRRLIITMPPRHGKSELCSRYFPAWYLARFPDHRIIWTSYEAEFAASWGGKARDVMAEYGPPLFGLGVREDATARHSWNIAEHDGGMATAGVGGPITGRGANLLGLDDPIKNAEQANSPTYREKTWDWWQSTAYTRLEPDGVVLVILTRWHEADLAGKLIAESASDESDDEEKWHILNLPALAEGNDPMGRKEGEALWPDRWPADKLEKRKRRFGSYVWSALYQQRPAPEEGGKFKRNWFRYYRREGEFYRLITGGADKLIRISDCTRFMTGDVAGTEKRKEDASDPDYSVFGVWDLTDSGYLIAVDFWRDRCEEPSIVRAGARLMRQHECGVGYVEKNGLGTGVVSTLRERGFAIVPIIASTSKATRAQVAQVRFEAGMIFLPLNHPELVEVESELLSFPNAAHDDIVDNFSIAALQAQRSAGAPPVREDIEDLAKQETQEHEEEEKLVAAGRPTRALEEYGELEEPERSAHVWDSFGEDE